MAADEMTFHMQQNQRDQRKARAGEKGQAMSDGVDGKARQHRAEETRCGKRQRQHTKIARAILRAAHQRHRLIGANMIEHKARPHQHTAHEQRLHARPQHRQQHADKHQAGGNDHRAIQAHVIDGAAPTR